MITVSTALRSIPASSRLVWNCPTAPLLCSKGSAGPVSYDDHFESGVHATAAV